MCPGGSYQPNEGQASCLLCLEGEFGPEGSSACTPCEAAFYNDAIGAAECVTCPAGRVSAVGAINLEECVNPLPNFAIACIILAFVAFLALPYVMVGRFHHASFVRQSRVYEPLFNASKVINEQLMKIVSVYSEVDRVAQKTSSYWRCALVIVYIAISFIIMFLFCILCYAFVLSRVLYSSLIIWKSFAVNSNELNNFYDKMEEVSSALGTLTVSFTSLVVDPFIWLYQKLSTISLDFNEVEVTCRGSQAPLELFVNMVILGGVVIIIESNFHVYANVVFGDLNRKLANHLFHVDLHLNEKKQGMLAIICASMASLLSLNPLIKIMQFSTSILTFSAFVEKHGALHESTKACDDALEDAPMIDTVIAYMTSSIAWLIVFPVTYTMAKILVPGGNAMIPRKFQLSPHEADSIDQHSFLTWMLDFDVNENKTFSMRSLCSYCLRMSSFIAADLLMVEVLRRWVNYLSYRLGVQGATYTKLSCPMLASFKQSNLSEDEEWLNRRWEHSLPHFFELSAMVHNECMDRLAHHFDIGYSVDTSKRRWLIDKISMVLSFTIFSHMLTDVGCIYLLAVVEKYYIFLLVSLGIWTDACIEAFDLFKETKRQIRDKVEITDESDPDYTYRGILQFKQQKYSDATMKINGSSVDFMMEWNKLSGRQKSEYISLAKEQILCLGDVESVNDETMHKETKTGVHCLDQEHDSDPSSYELPVNEKKDTHSIDMQSYVEGKEKEEYARMNENLSTGKISVNSQQNTANMMNYEIQYTSFFNYVRLKLVSWGWAMQPEQHDTIVSLPHETPLGSLKTNNDDIVDTVGLLHSIIAPRCVLFLIIPSLAPLSIYGSITSGSPLLVYSNRADQQKYFAPYFIKDVFKQACQMEMIEGCHTTSVKFRRLYWTIYVKAVEVWWKDSRLLQIVFNLFEFCLTIGLLYGDVVSVPCYAYIYMSMSACVYIHLCSM